MEHVTETDKIPKMAEYPGKHPFSADRPIPSRREDLLGRSQFADSLAAAIKGWKGNDSLVIALQGPWGSGKSSLKNLVLEILFESPEPRHIIVEFNPWQWAGHDDLSRAFFHDVGVALGRADTSKEGKKRAAKWKSYGAFLQAGSFLAVGIRRLVTALLFLIGLLGIASSVIETWWFNAVLATIGLASLVAAFLAWTGTFFEKAAAALDAGSEASKLELHEEKKQLAQSLKELPTPLLLVIDDVDRLSSAEVKTLFQLVKANADFPNVIYLLLFQRDIVEKSLEEMVPVAGKDFLEKIVQVSFHVPRIERARLERVLFSGLDNLLRREAVGRRFKKQRWQNLFVSGLRLYYQNLRDVHRYLAVLSFHVSLFEDNNSFNVNPIDLIAIEALRVFEPNVYELLADRKSTLTRPPMTSSEDWGTEITTLITFVKEQLPEARREPTVEILKQLFPKVDWALSSYGYGSGFDDGWFRDLRVCHSDVFDRYFQLGIAEGDISQADLDLLLFVAGDRERLVAVFESLKRRGISQLALDRLEAYKERINRHNATDFVTAIFDIGDDLRFGRSSLFELRADWTALRIIHWYLRNEKDLPKRTAVLKEAMQLTLGLYLPVMQTSLEERKQDRTQDDPDAFLVDEDALQSLKEMSLSKIRSAAEDGRLRESSRLLYLLYRWQAWGSPEEPKEWVESLVASEHGLISFIKSLVQEGVISGAEDYVGRAYRYISLKCVEDFIPPERIQERIKQIKFDALTEDEKEAVKAFERALNRRQEGTPDDDWEHDTDED